MKSLVLGLLLFSASFAHAECAQLEAQVIAHVGKILAENDTTCTVTLDFSAPHSMLNSHYACPLDVDDISMGVTLPKNNGACPAQPGSVLSGILYKAFNGSDTNVYLE
ncbi:hypothetical protein [Bdellovibrio svalbardensis]|uniref:Uncharacterized protein n=1 Tax=Bdellovibrio svalbardensis TaxID=2972972 RepID=A0ABT6DLW6_9BACT|nr:hypothetical protein [Bdellovibrio svalbardensis]MDG0817870.1 hypothetical protein [Bdellovibrio svalbardensis]